MALDTATNVSRPRVVEVDDATDLVEFCYDQGWTDGLPVVPPTPERVAAALDATGLAPDEVLCTYEERRREVTVEHVAVNAVMAGCRPEYTAVVVALTEALANAYGVHAANATTGGAAIAFFVNGPIRLELGMNSRGNVLGPGNRPNSTIGRALRLVMINAFGSVPGAGNEALVPANGRPILDRATVGQPGKYACYHVVENEEDFPTLLPLHVERGFAAGQDVVTVFGTVGHLQISAHHESSAEEIVDTIAHYLVHSGRLNQSNVCGLVIPPESAEIFVRDGWTKADIRNAVYEGTKRSVAWVRRNGWTLSGGMLDRRGAAVLPGDDERYAAIAKSPDDVLVAVAGGPAGAFIHALFQYGASVSSREIRRPKEA
jgi:hypothetical protein